MTEVKAGLQGVVIAQTSICSIDGERGQLLYRGYDIHDLAAHSTFEEVIYLLWYGRLPNRHELDALQKELTGQRAVAPEVLDLLKKLPRAQHPMETLRTMVSALALFDAEAETMTEEANRRKAARLTAQIGTLVAAMARTRAGKEPVAPDPKLGHAANFLYMLQGKPPDTADARDFDVALILHADHSFNASTFAARVTASTLSDLQVSLLGSVYAGLGVCKWPVVARNN